VDARPTFGSLLKRYRRAAHLTQEGLAERAGYSSHYVSMLERGVRSAQPLTVDVLADALSLPKVERAALHAAAEFHAPAVQTFNDWPAPSPTLLGREEEMARILMMLVNGDIRLLTLTGPGGVGKTALARRAAATLTPDFRDGAAFVDLSTVALEDVIPAIARRFALRAMGSTTLDQRLKSFLEQREVLLVLDGFERVVEAGAQLAELLASCSSVKALVTSRTPLRVRAETEFQVQPLAMPSDPRVASMLKSPAVALFLQKARQAKPEIALDEARLRLVAEICRRLDGLPLAIELAAARVSHLPLATLHDRLENRLQMLTGGSRDLPPRQQRMRDTIGWSYDLLAPSNQILFRRLSVFAGSCSLEAAEEVCGPHASQFLDGLRSLVESSLLVPVLDTSHEPRYRLLDTVREYAAEQLAVSGESAAMQVRHSSYFVRLGEEAEATLQDENQQAWYPLLEREHDNLRTALQWLVDTGDAEATLRLAGSIWRFWQRHGDIREGRQWLESALSVAGTVPAGVRGKAIWGASWLAYHQGDYTRTRDLSNQYLALAREQGDALSERNALTGLGMAAIGEGRYDEALQRLQAALDASLSLGNTWHRATSSLNLGSASMLAGDFAAASALFEKALTMYQERGDEVFAARTRQHLGYVALLQDNFAEALDSFTESLRALVKLEEKIGIADGLEAAAALHAATGNAVHAIQLVQAAAVLRESIGLVPLPYLQALWQPLIDNAESLLPETDRASARQAGRAMSFEDAVDSALPVHTLTAQSSREPR
jgi:predicted ATPase/transcriptional regulator with XRE-family HTH domain